MHELRVNCYYKSYKLLFAYELRVTVYCTSYNLLFTCELRVAINCTSYSNSKYKDDKAVYDNKVMIKNYSLGSFFDKELGAREASFSCCLHLEWPTQKLTFYNMISF